MPNDMSPSVATPRTANDLNSVGAQLFGQGQMEAARMHFLAALQAEPEHPQALMNLGAVLRVMGHYAASESVARRSIKATPSGPANVICRSNLAVAQFSSRKFPEALANLQSVVDDMPDSAPGWHNYGLVLYAFGKLTDALAAFDKSLALKAENPQCKSDRAMTLLALGELETGLVAYEARWHVLPKSPIWDLGIPEWQGEDLAGQRLLVHHEQGFGDGIMLSRFLAPLVALGANVTVAIPKELARLFSASFPFVTVLPFEGDGLVETSAFDYHTPFLSVLRWLDVRRVSEISPAAYLSVPTDGKAFHVPKADFRVGIVWASGRHSRATEERRRLVPLSLFLPLTEIPNIAVISLQKGPEAVDIARNGMEGLVYDMDYALQDFGDTAQVISTLDCVISVDSAVAHVAGGLGKPTIVLSPFTRCWRWWGGTYGLPWYDQMRLFSQSVDSSWDEAMTTAVKLVADVVASGRRSSI